MTVFVLWLSWPMTVPVGMFFNSIVMLMICSCLLVRVSRLIAG